MLSFKKLEDGRTFVRINYSSLSLMNECKRKAHYILNKSMVNEHESEALTFGSAIHKALEHWYSLPVVDRVKGLSNKPALELLSQGVIEESIEASSALKSIAEFVTRADALATMQTMDKRSLDNGVKILAAYFKHYADDKLHVLEDEQGPFIERQFSFILHEDAELVIEYFGTIDCILQNVESGLVFVADHKTTAALGKEFFNRLQPNHQYTGYVLAAQKCFGLNTNVFMVNGIQVAKTKQEFSRQFTSRSDEDFEELRLAVLTCVKEWLALESFPMNSPGPCSSYGGCQYLSICSVPNKLKQTIVNASYKGVIL